MSQQEHSEENLLPIPDQMIQQQVKNSTLGGGMQAAMDNDNIQIQGDSNIIRRSFLLALFLGNPDNKLLSKDEILEEKLNPHPTTNTYFYIEQFTIIPENTGIVQNTKPQPSSQWNTNSPRRQQSANNR